MRGHACQEVPNWSRVGWLKPWSTRRARRIERPGGADSNHVEALIAKYGLQHVLDSVARRANPDHTERNPAMDMKQS